jgi:hypothetical protein
MVKLLFLCGSMHLTGSYSRSLGQSVRPVYYRGETRLTYSKGYSSLCRPFQARRRLSFRQASDCFGRCCCGLLFLRQWCQRNNTIKFQFIVSLDSLLIFHNNRNMSKSVKRNKFILILQNKVVLCMISLFLSFVFWVFFSLSGGRIEATSFPNLIFLELLSAIESILPLVPILAFIDLCITNRKLRFWFIVGEGVILSAVAAVRFRYAMLHWLLFLSVLSGFSIYGYDIQQYSRDPILGWVSFLGDGTPISEVDFYASGKTPQEVDEILNKRMQTANDQSDTLFGKGVFHIQTTNLSYIEESSTKVLNKTTLLRIMADPF